MAKTIKLRRSVWERPAPRNLSPPKNWLWAPAFETFNDGNPAIALTELLLNMLEVVIVTISELMRLYRIIHKKRMWNRSQ